VISTPFGNFYKGKTVLLTGDTGFKGSWLAVWLTHLGAKVVGYSLAPPTEPSNFKACSLGDKILHIEADIRDYDRLYQVCQEQRPDVIFHLAAQPLVRLSFEKTRYTFDTNLMGTVNALEAARHTGSVQSVVAISSDKCYHNIGTRQGYRETDPLGGYDPYSASKACAELAIAVYRDSRFQKVATPQSNLPIASTRAGNVIGGGDWACDRIVPDTVRAIAAKRDIIVRNPDSIRPWQHVLEPLSSYLWLGALLPRDPKYCTSWNIAPDEGVVPTVRDVVIGLLDRWPSGTQMVVDQDASFGESKLLQLDCTKAKEELKWHGAWGIERTLDAIVAWYKHFYEQGNDADMYTITTQQIEEYTQAARGKEIAWASGSL
jgi:CDP-glucose 4,6-dehydratase